MKKGNYSSFLLLITAKTGARFWDAGSVI